MILKTYSYTKPENEFQQADGGTYLLHGRLWLETAKDMKDNNIGVSYFEPFYYIVSHACELTIKGFLLKKGLSHKELRNKFSHSLELLVNQSIKQGLMIDNKFTPFFDALINLNFSNKQRYPLHGSFLLGDPDYVDAENLLKWAEKLQGAVKSSLDKKAVA